MKKLILFLLLIISCSSYAQEPYALDSVIRAENKTAKEIYTSVKAWSSTAFVNAKHVTQVDDPDACFISFNAASEYSHGGLRYLSFDGWVNYTITVKCKDGRLKVTMTNLIHKPLPNHGSELGLILDMEQQFTKGLNKKFNNTVASDIKEKARIRFLGICDEIKNAIENQAMSTDDDW